MLHKMLQFDYYYLKEYMNPAQSSKFDKFSQKWTMLLKYVHL